METSSRSSFFQRHRKLFVLIFLFCVGLYGSTLTLPNRVGLIGETLMLSDTAVRFLSDETYLNQKGERESTQQIFDEVFSMIDSAQKYILVDMFLWNPFQGASPELHRPLSQELTDKLIAKKNAHPEMTIVVVSDPINTVYAGQASAQFDAMKASGIIVVLTDLGHLRDSNPLYSALWRGVFQWGDVLHLTLLDKPYTFRWLPNIMDNGGEKVPLRSYLKLFNFKANHRKLIVVDDGKGEQGNMVTLVTSANPHDGSSMHSNVALRIEGGVWNDVVLGERSIGEFSGVDIPDVEYSTNKSSTTGAVSVQYLTENGILLRTLSVIEKAGTGDEVDLAMFYFSERKIIDALISASNRGAVVRVILDANKDAFGLKKNGIPNRSVAGKLIRESQGKIVVRWCETHGEQCHSKMLIVKTPEESVLLLGSANFTKRNLENLNLEADVLVASKESSTAFLDARSYFLRMWNNENDRIYTSEYEAYRDDSLWHRILGYLMERTGLSTF